MQEQQKVDAAKNAVKNAAEARQRAVLMAWQAQLAGAAPPAPEPEADPFLLPPTQAPPPPPPAATATAAPTTRGYKPSAQALALSAALEDDLSSLLSDLDAAVAAKSSPVVPGPQRQPSACHHLWGA